MVLDKTVSFSDDEPVGDSQVYLELSEGEEEEEEKEEKKKGERVLVSVCQCTWGFEVRDVNLHVIVVCPY